MQRTSPDRERFRLLVVGIGGQGVLTAARYLGDAAFSAGLEVVSGQLHGLSQRRGSVRSTVLIGPGRSSFISRGAADVVLGLEPLEVLRARPEMSAGTRVVINRGRVAPRNFAQDDLEYPDVDRILADVRAVAPQVVEVDGPAVVEAVGSPHVLNIAMLGALAGLRILPVDAEDLWRAVEMRCPPQHVEPNRRAFALGRDQVRA
jgi:indolepyruvate ferredoxin oxidoreductase beta subunit